jgi:hypothetical protein
MSVNGVTVRSVVRASCSAAYVTLHATMKTVKSRPRIRDIALPRYSKSSLYQLMRLSGTIIAAGVVARVVEVESRARKPALPAESAASC